MAVTRALAGVGIGLLIADMFDRSQRRAVGWSLLLTGAITTIPLAAEVLGKEHVESGPRVEPVQENELATCCG